MCVLLCFFFFKQKTAYEMLRSLVGSEMCIRDRAYTTGVMLACLALGVLLLALRAAGEEVGWAFQLQEPLVVAGLLLLAAAITANLLGVYEFSVPGLSLIHI